MAHIMHLHHRIPKHAGGTDEPENLVEVTAEQHAELHFALYLEYGRWEDYRAARGLAGLQGWEDAAGYGFKGRKHTEETKRKIGAKSSATPRSEEWRRKIGEKNKGKKKGMINEVQAKPWMINDVTYPSQSAAARAVGKSRYWVVRWGNPP